MFTGIVTAVGRVSAVARNGGEGRGRGNGEGVNGLLLTIRAPRAVREVAIRHGAIAVDGVSLTINDLAPDFVQISLIPFTRRHTTLGTLRVGDRVHVEGDVLGKYVRQLCSTAT